MWLPISEQRPWSAATMPCSDKSSLGFPFQSVLIPMLLLSAPAQGAVVPQGARLVFAGCLFTLCGKGLAATQQFPQGL